MSVKGQQVSRNSKGMWCNPNHEYGPGAHNVVYIKVGYKIIETISSELDSSDEEWPKGAVIKGFYKVDNQIVKGDISTG